MAERLKVMAIFINLILSDKMFLSIFQLYYNFTPQLRNLFSFYLTNNQLPPLKLLLQIIQSRFKKKRYRGRGKKEVRGRGN
jgi:hypothetical protein